MKTFELQFETEDNKTVRVAVDEPIEPVDPASVKTAMEQIIAANVFHNTGGFSYTAIKGAQLVERNVTEFTIA